MDGNIPIDAFHQGDMIVVGDPEQCFNKMKHYADLGVDELICYVQFGYHWGESTMKPMELRGREVLPELEKYTPVNIDANIAQFIDGGTSRCRRGVWPSSSAKECRRPRPSRTRHSILLSTSAG